MYCVTTVNKKKEHYTLQGNKEGKYLFVTENRHIRYIVKLNFINKNI